MMALICLSDWEYWNLTVLTDRCSFRAISSLEYLPESLSWKISLRLGDNCSMAPWKRCWQASLYHSSLFSSASGRVSKHCSTKIARCFSLRSVFNKSLRKIWNKRWLIGRVSSIVSRMFHNLIKLETSGLGNWDCCPQGRIENCFRPKTGQGCSSFGCFGRLLQVWQ